MFFTRRAALAMIATLPIATPAFAGKPKIYSKRGYAIRGYDPVAYFEQSAPVKGSPEHSFEWMGATWLFASAASKSAFAQKPETYAPQFGGYCAYAVSKGATASTNPNAWTVYEGKLYLNFSVGVRAIWREDIRHNIKQANNNWPGVLG